MTGCREVFAVALILGLCAQGSAQEHELGEGKGSTIIPVEGLPDRGEPEEDKKPDPAQEARKKEARQRAVAAALMGAGGQTGWLKRGWRWDLNLDLALGKNLDAGGETLFLGRARTGATRVMEPAYLTLGATAEINTGAPPAFGLQMELLEMSSAIQLQAGGLIDTGGVPLATAAIGWQLFALEGQLRFDEETETLLFFKLRVPISWIYYYFTLYRPAPPG